MAVLVFVGVLEGVYVFVDVRVGVDVKKELTVYPQGMRMTSLAFKIPEAICGLAFFRISSFKPAWPSVFFSFAARLANVSPAFTKYAV